VSNSSRLTGFPADNWRSALFPHTTPAELFFHSCLIINIPQSIYELSQNHIVKRNLSRCRLVPTYLHLRLTLAVARDISWGACTFLFRFLPVSYLAYFRKVGGELCGIAMIHTKRE